MEKIIVIGDSHSQLFDANPNLRRGSWSNPEIGSRFEVRWLGPFTYFRLSRDQRNFIDFNSDLRYCPHPGMEVSTKIEAGRSVVISLGEIDVRCNIFKHAQKNYLSSIDLIAQGIEEFVSIYKDKYKLHLLSVPPPMEKDKCISPNSDFPFVGEDVDRLSANNYFNEKLIDISKKHSVGYLDINSIYSDEFGMMDLDKSDKIVHCIKTVEFEDYIEKYFNL